MLKLAYVGGLGMMASPAAIHLKTDGPARVLRVHDRGTKGGQRDEFRENWRNHGAELVSDFDTLIGDGGIDGVVACCGKNGDDIAMIAELTALLSERNKAQPFIAHMSTVSAGFAEQARVFCSEHNVRYVNYPLTGGPAGALNGGGHPQGMLILASGDKSVYEETEATLQVLGRPRYFGETVAAGAETKLIGQHLVFNGCTGICTAASLYSECFASGAMGGKDQTEYFEFLNGGAGGTRQWDVALSKGVRDDTWDQGFGVKHAVVDAVYSAQLALDKGLPLFSIQPMLNIALAFSFLLKKYPAEALATHAIARELLSGSAKELNAFIAGNSGSLADVPDAIERCIASLPEAIQQTVKIDVSADDFRAAV